MTGPPLSGSSESPQDPDAPDQARKPRRRRWWHVPRFLRNGLVVGILFLLVWYIVIPEFFANSKSIHAIEHVNVLVLLAGGALEVLSLFAFAKLTIVVLPENSISVYTLSVKGGHELHAGNVETYDDHRMAMALASLGAVLPGVKISDPGCVSKTYPGFWRDIAGLGLSYVSASESQSR